MTICQHLIASCNENRHLPSLVRQELSIKGDLDSIAGGIRHSLNVSLEVNSTHDAVSKLLTGKDWTQRCKWTHCAEIAGCAALTG
jgi:hypothetical protein